MDAAKELRHAAVCNELRISLERWGFILDNPDKTSASEIASLRRKILGLEQELGLLSEARV
jgi:hypothetical protein